MHIQVPIHPLVQALVTMASFNRTVSKVYFTEDFPILELGLNPADPFTVQEGGEARPVYKDDMVITGSVFGNGESIMDIEQLQVSGTYDLNEVTSIDFGVATTEVTNRSLGSNVQRDTWGVFLILVISATFLSAQQWKITLTHFQVAIMSCVKLNLSQLILRS